jgi:hypothetical protein
LGLLLHEEESKMTSSSSFKENGRGREDIPEERRAMAQRTISKEKCLNILQLEEANLQSLNFYSLHLKTNYLQKEATRSAN